RPWVIGAGVLAVLATAWAFTVRGGGDAVAVDVGAVDRREVFRSHVTASGEIVATRFADIGSSVMGRIVELTVAEGDAVKAGQVLARLDPVQARSGTESAIAQVAALEAEETASRQQVQAATADVAQAEARALQAAQAFARVRDLHAQGLTTSADLDAGRAAADAAAAQVQAAKATLNRGRQLLAAADRRIAQARAGLVSARDILSKTAVVAPIDGIVTRLQVRLGEMVVIGIQNQPGTTLMTISDLSAIDAEIKVAEADILRVRVGQPAAVILEAIPGSRFQGRVVEVGASALPVVGAGAAAREFRVVVRLDKPDPGLRPGLTCDAEVLTAERKGVLTVPLQAVVLRTGADEAERAGVFAVRQGRAAFVPVKAGIIGGLDIQIEEVAGSPLPAGTPVVVGPFQVLRDLEDGSAVKRVDGER
ncbi:MAG TPA: efflux RND transporter periplasmic adaptor subunit, partial [Vicinamibacterales bacterium]|nr:efflux RND transporter periplasmic adaptor subunit [Vicinamibacterales bacterium]